MKQFKIKYKFSITILIVTLVAAVPLSTYMLYKQENEKIEHTIAIGRGNSKLLARNMLDVFLKSGGEPASTKIDAEEAIGTFKDQYELGLVFAQAVFVTKKHYGLLMATLDKNNTGDKNTQGKTTTNAEARKTEAEIKHFQTFEQNHEGPCFNNPKEKCFNFSFTAKYDKIPVLVSGISISERHVLAPIRKLRRLIYIGAGVAIVGALLLGVGVSRFITGPIATLVEGVHKYSQGNLKHRVEIRVKDELQTLGTAFNEMAGQIEAKIREIEDHRDNLEIKVKERTSELSTALTQVSKLKEQQDADYYLTGFLLKPLCINRNNSEFIETEFFLKQKKEYRFRDKTGEIGGDICITANILFAQEGKVQRYTFATNADAMGKSIQGAGGAIVFGTAINTILASSTANNRVLETQPKDWLIRMYKELHNIFLSFDGSMLVSAVIMLINEHDGRTYFINAEHPWSILLRDNVADFIEDDLMLRKLGADLPGQEAHVREFELMPGDVLIIGSDGRDDVVVNEAEDDMNRVINEDERAVLTHVKSAGGELQTLVNEIKKTGGLSDDLSLIKVYVRALNQEYPSRHNIADKAVLLRGYLADVKNLIQIKNFDKATEIIQKIAVEFDTRTVPQYFVLKARLEFQIGEFEKAHESMKQYFETGNESASSYKTLGNILYKLKKKKAATEAWEKALLMNPEDETLKSTLAELNNKKKRAVMIS